jgi:hypothetical protein
LSTMPQTYVKRVTLFKVAKPEDVDQVSGSDAYMTTRGADQFVRCFKHTRS